MKLFGRTVTSASSEYLLLVAFIGYRMHNTLIEPVDV